MGTKRTNFKSALRAAVWSMIALLGASAWAADPQPMELAGLTLGMDYAKAIEALGDSSKPWSEWALRHGAAHLRACKKSGSSAFYIFYQGRGREHGGGMLTRCGMVDAQPVLTQVVWLAPASEGLTPQRALADLDAVHGPHSNFKGGFGAPPDYSEVLERLCRGGAAWSRGGVVLAASWIAGADEGSSDDPPQIEWTLADSKGYAELRCAGAGGAD